MHAEIHRPAPLIELTPQMREQASELIVQCGLEGTVARIVGRAAELEPAIYRLAAYLPGTISAPYTRKPLFQTCIEAADEHMQVQSDPLEGFFSGVLGHAPYVLRYRLVGRSERWNPIEGPPLATWLRQSGFRPGRTLGEDPPWPVVSLTDFANALFERLLQAGVVERPKIVTDFNLP